MDLENALSRSALQRVHKSGDGYMACCPLHDDHRPSLHLWSDDRGELAFSCLAGCDWALLKERLVAMGLPVTSERRATDAAIGATYDYCDEDGALLFQVVRLVPKDFRQRRPDGLGGWIWKMEGVRRVLFRLPELREGIAAGETVYVTEGEKDALSAVAAGAVATCNPGGAGKWRSEYGETLRDAKVVIVADRDEPGRAHAAKIAASLRGVAESVRIVEAMVGKDASDHLAAGHSLRELVPVEGPVVGICSQASAPRTAICGSDLDNAERFIAMFGEKVRHCALEKRWYIYDGRRWAPDDRLAVEDLMRQALLSVFAEAARAASDAEAKKLASGGLRQQSAHARRAALECARSDPRIAIHPSEFDRQPDLLNCANGTLDLRSGSLRRHDPADLIRKLAPVAYEPDAHLALWESFLDEATGGDTDLRAYLQRAAGYSLTGETGERVFFLLLGPTTTGKSTFVEALLATLGDYAQATGIEAFLRRTHVGGPRPEIATLAGRRLVTGIEVDEERRLDEVLIKQLVGGDTVAERDLYAGADPFVPECKLWFAANAAPRMNDADDALWVRVRVIPFAHQIPERRRDPALKAALRDPEKGGPAILAWALRGCLDRRSQGLGSVPAVEQATRTLRLSMDPLGDFLVDCCSFDAATFTTNAELRRAYCDWLAASGSADRIGPRKWGERLKSHGLMPGKEHGQRGYHGVRLA